MKKVFLSLILSISIVGLTSCGILHKNLGIFGKASKAEDKAKSKIELVDNTKANVDVKRLDLIGEYSAGVFYALNKDTNQSPAVTAAQSLNERIMALANKPDLNEVKSIAAVVDQLLTNQVEGQRLLEKKDKEVKALSDQLRDLQIQKEKALKDYMALADKNAAKEDQYQATLRQMDAWGGLGAIGYGIKHLIIRLSWILGIGSVLFIILRIASMSNPIASALFQVFDVIGSWFVHAIQVIVPKAMSLAGNVTVKVFSAYKSTLTKIVDAVQMAKTNAVAAGKQATLQDVLDEAEKSMNTDEKQIVEEIKKALNWK